ncbi:DUF6176 family protein [Haladaptatus sp. NG-SE-30]
MKELKSVAEEEKEGVLEIWEKESLQTLSLFIERMDHGDYLVWYIEADDIDQLIAARRNSTHPLHDLEDEIMAEVLESPENVGEFEPVFHGVNPDQPNPFVVE